jgi:predicted dehydrogenase
VIRAGILGAGFMGGVRAAAWRNVARAHVVGIATLDPDGHPRLRTFEGRLVTDAREILRVGLTVDITERTQLAFGGGATWMRLRTG